MIAMFPELVWLTVRDSDPRAFALYSRHYTYRAYKDNRRSNPVNSTRFAFVGPGEKMVLLTADCCSLFVWRKFIDASGQEGVNCAIFRNEGDELSSRLILAAEELAWQRWPGERLYTYVNQNRVSSSNPGYCFKMAGWQTCGFTKSGLTVLEKNPEGERHDSRNRF